MEDRDVHLLLPLDQAGREGRVLSHDASMAVEKQRYPFNQSKSAMQASSSGGGSDGMEARLAKVEAAIEHIQSDLNEIKTDIREFRSQIADIRDKFSEAKVWALLLYVSLGTGLLFAMAKGFKWL